MTGIWLFGYGSLIWRPDFSYRERRVASLRGWARRFWQGSHDHRGLPHAPGRVVTLVRDPAATCQGVAYLIDKAVAHAVFADIDRREKNGYERTRVQLQLDPGGPVDGVVYIAHERNAAFLGPAPLAEMARQIAGSHGPSGSNAEYLMELAAALRAMGARDAHVFELEQAVDRHVAAAGP
jgi:cation transport protein ChaC